jgi:hypothetical protein
MNASFEAVPFPPIEAVTFRELEKDELGKLLPFLKANNWDIPYPKFAAVWVAEYEGQIVGFAVQQILPVAGPLFVVQPWRGTGLAEMLARDLKERMAVNYIAVASSEFSEKLCRELGMHEVPGKLFRK